MVQGVDDVDYIVSTATKARYPELADRLASIPRKDKEPVIPGLLAGLDQLPQGILRQYLIPYLKRRQKG